MSDEIAKSVAQETMQVPLQKGDRYNQAFLDVGDRLVAVLSGEPDPGPPVIVDNVKTEGTFRIARRNGAEQCDSLGDWLADCSNDHPDGDLLLVCAVGIRDLRWIEIGDLLDS